MDFLFPPLDEDIALIPIPDNVLDIMDITAKSTPDITAKSTPDLESHFYKDSSDQTTVADKKNATHKY